MMPQSQSQQQYLPLMPQPSNLLKILTCFFLVGMGVALGAMFSSYITATVPFFSLQSIHLPLPPPLPPLQSTHDTTIPTTPLVHPQPTQLTPPPQPIYVQQQPPPPPPIHQEPPQPTQHPEPPIQEPPPQAIHQEPPQPTQHQEPPIQEPPPQAIHQQPPQPTQHQEPPIQEPPPQAIHQEPPQPTHQEPIQEPPQAIQREPPPQPTQQEPIQEPPPQAIQREPPQQAQQEPIQLIKQEPPQTIEHEPLPQQRVGLGDDVMSDAELLRRAAASVAPKEPADAHRTAPKVAFMFLARGQLPFRPLWEMFFRGHEGLYSIYLHLSPMYNGTVPRDSVFFERRIPSQAVSWGHVNMMEAERRLLANALLDHSNERFVLLSEACVPLWNFPTIYSYLVNSTETFVKVFDDPSKTGRGRYNRHMSPLIEPGQWRKSSQWFEVDRKLAIEIISDSVYFPVFKRYCKGGCYVDEHYLPTLINIKYGARNSNRSVTWVNWSIGGPHPARYIRKQVTPGLIEMMREGEGNCTYNGRPTKVCYLFARKFLPNTLIRFQIFAPRVLGFGDDGDVRRARGGNARG